jgi:hypothetical protein
MAKGLEHAAADESGSGASIAIETGRTDVCADPMMERK